MQIVIVSADFRPNTGGIASHAWDLAEGLVRLKQDVTVIGGHLWVDPARPARLPQSSFTLHLRENGRGVHGGPRLLSLPRSALEHTGWIRWARARMREICARRVPEIVHWHTPFYDPFVVQAAPRSAARVFTNHRSDVFGMLDSSHGRAVLRLLDGSADLVLAPSPERAERSARLGVPSDRCRFVPNGIDASRFVGGARSERLAAELGIDPADQVVIVVARPVPVKGLRHAIAALPAIVKEHPAAKLLMVGGDGSPHQQELVQRARELGVEQRVVWAGERPNSQMPELYRLASVALVPSLSEGMSVAALEAMAAGLPLVATDVGSNAEILGSGRAGLLVPPADSAAISRAVCRLMLDPALRAGMGEAGRTRVLERYTLSAVCENVLALYREAVELAAAR